MLNWSSERPFACEALYFSDVPERNDSGTNVGPFKYGKKKQVWSIYLKEHKGFTGSVPSQQLTSNNCSIGKKVVQGETCVEVVNTLQGLLNQFNDQCTENGLRPNLEKHRSALLI